jgi:hypothetical protein
MCGSNRVIARVMATNIAIEIPDMHTNCKVLNVSLLYITYTLLVGII